MVEVQLDESEGPLPMWLLVAFAACTTLLVSVHMLALMISTCISPHIEAIASVPGLFSVAESPHEKMSFYVEVAWAFSTVFGILLFMIEIIILCWLKFWGIGRCASRRTDSSGCTSSSGCTFSSGCTDGSGSGSGRVSSIVATVILIPVVVIFIAFAVHFYRKLVAHQHERTAKDLDELENMMSQLQDGDENGTNAANVANVANLYSGDTLPVSESRTTIQSTLPEHIQLHEVKTI